MFSYTYKPVVVQAVQYSSLQGDITQVVPAWLINAIIQKRIMVTNAGSTVLVRGAQQIHIDEGDWIIFDPATLDMEIFTNGEFERLFEKDNRDAKAC